jgi:predicted transcriptional regulator
MSEELDFEMPMALCSNYQASMGEIEELKEKIAELERENAELKKQNVELTKIIKDYCRFLFSFMNQKQNMGSCQCSCAFLTFLCKFFEILYLPFREFYPFHKI